MAQPKLYMILLGCTPPKRNTEQHDIFFSIGESLSSLKQEMIDFWPDANGHIHIDAWREVSRIAGYNIQVLPAQKPMEEEAAKKLFFINLGGYKQNEFDEFHYKLLVPAKDKAHAIQMARDTAFYKHVGFKGADSHIDDKYGVDVDDIYNIQDILPKEIKQKYTIRLLPEPGIIEDEMHLGYLKLSRL